MTIRTCLLGAGLGAVMMLPLAAYATTVNVGTTVISTGTQHETLTNGDDFTLATTVYQNTAGLYTYQYALTNVNDPNGITTLGPAVNSASDFGTSGLTFFFGGAATGGTVTVDGTEGNDAANGLLAPVSNSAGTAAAYANGARVIFVTQGAPIAAGSSNVSQLGDYYYLQSTSAPGSFDINVTDSGSLDFPGPTPGAPEPSSVASFAIGGIGLLALALRVRKSRRVLA